MQSHIIDKIIEVEGRRFVVRKFTAFTGVKIGKMLISKILPVAQSFVPAISKTISILALYVETEKADTPTLLEQVKEQRKNEIKELVDKLNQYISLEGISHALDLVSEADMNFIMQSSLMCCSEQLPAGSAPVMRSDGTFGVKGVEYDPLLMLRLVCEAVLWGLGDFFTADRWTSIMKPLLNSQRQNPLT